MRPCLDCGRLHGNPSRCGVCAAKYKAKAQAQRGSATARGYGFQWQKLSRAILTKHRATYGDACSGFRVPPHHSTDLTVDHVVPKSRGGTDHPSNLAVLCRGCNSRKRNTV